MPPPCSSRGFRQRAERPCCATAPVLQGPGRARNITDNFNEAGQARNPGRWKKSFAVAAGGTASGEGPESGHGPGGRGVAQEPVLGVG